ncbi:hypothetical protein JCM10213_002781 [Rhodosporidiobolus nylandii]
MKASTALPLLALAATAVLAHDAHRQPRHLGAVAGHGGQSGAAGGMQLLRKRQFSLGGLGPKNDGESSSSAAETSAAPSSAAATTSASPPPAATSSSAAQTTTEGSSSAPATQDETSAEAASSSSSAPPVAESSSSAPAPASSSSSNSPAESSSSAATKGSTSASSASADEPQTLTSTLSASDSSKSGTASSSAASSSASSESDKKKDDSSSSGMSKAVLIPIIVVASCVAGIAAIWTIIRKTKFSPSRKFEAKLAPIDFVPGGADDPHLQGDHVGMLAHQRSQSQMSGAYGAGGGGYAASLARSDSGGKNSMRGMAMSESAHSLPSIPYNGPQYVQASYHGGYAAPACNTAQPGYPHEQAYGYADLHRAGSIAQPGSPAPGQLGRMNTMGSLAYDYGAQARAQSRAGQRY